MQTELAYCPTCDAQVRIALTPAPSHDGHANLPDAPELVCLELSGCCTGRTCALSNLPRPVMALRLARSHLPEEARVTSRMRCGGCGQVTEMEMVDRTALLCPLCGSVNRWILPELMERGWVAVERPDAA